MFPYFQKNPGIPSTTWIENVSNFAKTSSGKGFPRWSVCHGGLGVKANEAGLLPEKISGQCANGLGSVALAPARFIADAQAHLCLACARVNVEVSDRANGRLLLVLDDKPELLSIAVYVVALKDWQELFHRLRVGTMRIIAPDLVVALPMKDMIGVRHLGETQPDTFAMQR